MKCFLYIFVYNIVRTLQSLQNHQAQVKAAQESQAVPSLELWHQKVRAQSLVPKAEQHHKKVIKEKEKKRRIFKLI